MRIPRGNNVDFQEIHGRLTVGALTSPPLFAELRWSYLHPLKVCSPRGLNTRLVTRAALPPDLKSNEGSRELLSERLLRLLYFELGKDLPLCYGPSFF